MLVNILTGRRLRGYRPTRYDPDDTQQLHRARHGEQVPDVRRRRIEDLEFRLQSRVYGSGRFANEATWRELVSLYYWIGECETARIYQWMLDGEA